MPTIVPLFTICRFYQKFRPDPTDGAKVVTEDWVEIAPLGGRSHSTVNHKVSSLLGNLQPMSGGQSNPAIAMAHAKAAFLQPYYDAWKAGHEAPVDGTPLAAWNALSPEQAELLKSRGIRTVEELHALSDGSVERIPFPNLRDYIKQAKLFLQSADAARYAQDLAEKERKIEAQSVQLDDQADQIAALLTKVNGLADMVANLSSPAASDEIVTDVDMRAPGRRGKQAAA